MALASGGVFGSKQFDDIQEANGLLLPPDISENGGFQRPPTPEMKII